MKTFKNIVVLKQPIEPVWETMRDRLSELPPLVDDIESIRVLERHAENGKVRLLNEWRSSQSVPVFLQASLGASTIEWLDHNEWDNTARQCRWRIEPNVLRDHIRCEGKTSFEPAMGGRGTRVTIEGAFNLAPGAVRALTGPFEQAVTSFVESIVSTMIPRNFRKILEAAAELIRREERL
jgi:uncharacterized membrane protein